MVAALSLARLTGITHPCLRMRPGSLALPHAAARMLPAERAGVKGVTTPLDVANQISKGLAKKTVVAKVGDGRTRSSSRCRAMVWHAAVRNRCQALAQAALWPLLLAVAAPAPMCCGPCACAPAAAHPVSGLHRCPQVDGATWDLTRPLEGDCALQLLSFDDPEGKEVRRAAHSACCCCCCSDHAARLLWWCCCSGQAARLLCRCCSSCHYCQTCCAGAACLSGRPQVAGLWLTCRCHVRCAVLAALCVQTFWHSSAHVLGQALELEYGADLTIGPALEEGFYYDWCACCCSGPVLCGPVCTCFLLFVCVPALVPAHYCAACANQAYRHR